MLPVADEDTLLGVFTDVLKGCEYSELGSEQFVINEWLDIVDAWQLDSWDAYRNFKRLGRKTRLAENKRERLWAIFERFAERLAAEGLQTFASLLNSLSKQHEDRIRGPYDYIVIDEAQDITPMQLRFAGSVASKGQDNLFFAGDLGQRIFQTPFSWASLGVNIRGRARSLKINYRTSTKSDAKRIDFLILRLSTWTVMKRIDQVRSLFSMGQGQLLMCLGVHQRRVSGFQIG